MTEIEHRVEATGVINPDYSGKVFSDEEIADGKHRNFVGGVWDTHGERQLAFLIEQGLKPEHRFLDIGCGALRAGRHLVDYLDEGNYYGIDANLSLVTAGYEVELTDAQRARLPIANLRANERFDSDFGVPFDMAIAQSVFTHVSLNHIRLCLYRTGKVMRPGGAFYATFFEQPKSTHLDEIIIRSPRGRPHLSEQNLFWYYRSDLEWAAKPGPWKYRYIGRWGHPAGQRMVEFTRLDPEVATAKTAPIPPRPEPTNTGDKGRRFLARGLRSAARRIDVR